jgi:hypothetical protein
VIAAAAGSLGRTSLSQIQPHHGIDRKEPSPFLAVGSPTV